MEWMVLPEWDSGWDLEGQERQGAKQANRRMQGLCVLGGSTDVWAWECLALGVRAAHCIFE